jgi:hypothetical protein
VRLVAVDTVFLATSNGLTDVLAGSMRLRVFFSELECLVVAADVPAGEPYSTLPSNPAHVKKE